MCIRSIRKMLFAVVVLAISSAAFAQIRISVAFGPPALPVYEQPVCPGDGYLWTPGYWAWDGSDYYWVPGTWVESPEVGYLWTPPWWGWDSGAFLFHEGYWGPHIGFYGGISYGFGYFGVGFVGGRWDGGHFFYNRSVTNINVVNIHNVYNETIVNHEVVNHISYNGGEGGITRRPTPEEEVAEHDRHVDAVAAQREHIEQARGNPELRASANHGRPPIAATARPGAFTGHDVVEAREAGGEYHPPATRPEQGHPVAAPPTHVKDLPPRERPAAPNTGNPDLDKKYQQEQDKLSAQQDKERQKMQQQQDKEDQRATKSANQARQQQTEQKHQQQTQQLQQRHQQQQQEMQQRHSAPPAHEGKPK